MRRVAWPWLLLAVALHCSAASSRTDGEFAPAAAAESSQRSADAEFCRAFTSPPAEPPCGQPEFARRVNRTLKAMLEEPEFSAPESHWDLRRRNPDAPKPLELPDPSWLRWLARMRSLSGWLSSLGAVLLWLLAALLVALLLWKRALWLPYLQGPGPARGPARRTAVAVVRTATALPDDLEGSAQSAWQAGRHAEALSLLFRHALYLVSQRHAVRIPHGATEGEALRLLGSRAPELRQELARLTHAWMALAYAHRLPDDFEALLDCHRRIAGERP